MAGDLKIYIWDRVVRITHLLFIIGVVSAFTSYQLDLMTWHMWNGYAVLALVPLRILWGFIGSEHARFSAFLKGPAAVWAYVSTWPKQPVPPGHNALGGYAVLALLAALLLQAATGLFASDDIMTEGPLYSVVSAATADALTEIHEANFWFILLPLISLHIAAIIAYRLVKRADLVTPMITGYKKINS